MQCIKESICKPLAYRKFDIFCTNQSRMLSCSVRKWLCRTIRPKVLNDWSRCTMTFIIVFTVTIDRWNWFWRQGKRRLCWLGWVGFLDSLEVQRKTEVRLGPLLLEFRLPDQEMWSGYLKSTFLKMKTSWPAPSLNSQTPFDLFYLDLGDQWLRIVCNIRTDDR